MPILLIYVFFVVMVGYAANSKGRSAIGWALFALILSPLVAGCFLLLMSDARNYNSTNLEMEMRNEIIRQKYGSHIRAYKPAFSNSVIYETSVSGERMRFKDKGKALVYVAAILDQQTARPGPSGQSLPSPMPRSDYRS
ncbi:hypothetical protein SAMN05216360_1273 [Methylobacterium phyllostachyos]|uniref:Uncharacterized protein n=1 Tax=Methylobacterium phyllostachyos TaxID=582672 RepID=A0A1H0KGK6_9HYPH|nr:hypothetical protein [Methylobacterium phyllostachyos]SDO54953.1 hypothetical protein SAMN05216360_1273 [Methylobacterium phyllostachyos]